MTCTFTTQQLASQESPASATTISIPSGNGRGVMMRGIGRRSRGRRGTRLVAAVYLVIGLFVASTHGYLVAWNVPGNILEGLVAIVLWPLVALFGVNLHTLIA